MNEEERVTREREWFFAFYRRRVENVARFAPLPSSNSGDTPLVEPEWHVLVCAGLDSLAHHWAATLRPELRKPARRRMGEFLAAHGPGDVFSHVSTPDLLRRANNERRGSLVPAIRRHLRQEGLPGSVRTWVHDPIFSALATDEAFATVGADWLQQSRYGEVLYRELRCSWLHEYRSSESLAPPYDLEADSPRYQNLTRIRRGEGSSETEAPIEWTVQRLMFPVRFLMNVFAHATESFDRACTSARVSPMPNDEDEG